MCRAQSARPRAAAFARCSKHDPEKHEGRQHLREVQTAAFSETAGGFTRSRGSGPPRLSRKLRLRCRRQAKLRFAESPPASGIKPPASLPGGKYNGAATRPHGNLFLGRTMRGATAQG